MAGSISILGCTGSIGVQTLDAARNLGLEVSGLAAYSNIELLMRQMAEFRPRHVSVRDEVLAEELRKKLGKYDGEIYYGVEGLKKIATVREADTVVNAVVGIAGLIPTLEAIGKGKNVALANKETLVTAGKLVMSEARKNNVSVLPVDSEHSAIFQCMMGNREHSVSKLILTASGGPFRGKTSSALEKVTLEQALKHPNWSMGSKITIDSATLINKGLEVIEARWLFGLGLDRIEVLIHPQSIIHSMVEYVDGSVLAQLGSPDMRIPIQFALTYPERRNNDFSRLNLLETGKLTFEKPDYDAFPGLRLAYEALEAGGTMPVVLNAANEVAVSLFLHKEISFQAIPRIIERAMSQHNVNIEPAIDDIIEVDGWTRELVKSQIDAWR